MKHKHQRRFLSLSLRRRVRLKTPVLPSLPESWSSFSVSLLGCWGGPPEMPACLPEHESSPRS